MRLSSVSSLCGAGSGESLFAGVSGDAILGGDLATCGVPGGETDATGSDPSDPDDETVAPDLLKGVPGAVSEEAGGRPCSRSWRTSAAKRDLRWR